MLYRLAVMYFYLLLAILPVVAVLVARVLKGESPIASDSEHQSFIYKRFHSAAVEAAVVFAIALFVRMFLTDHNFYHGNAHGFNYLLKMKNIFENDVYRSAYGVGGFAFHHLTIAIFKTDIARTLFLTNIVVGSLTCAVVYLLVLSIWRHGRMALWAGLILAVMPSHARISASEILSIGGAFFGLSAMLFLSIYINTRKLKTTERKSPDDPPRVSDNPLPLAACAIAASISAQFLEIFNLYFLITALFLMFFLKGGSATRLRKLLFLWGATLACIVPHVLFVLFYSTKEMREAGYFRLMTNFANVKDIMFSRVNSLLAPDITPVFLMLLMIAGIIICIIKYDKKMLGIIFITLVFSTVDFMKTLTEDNRVIFHVDYHPYAAMIMAFGVTAIQDAFSARAGSVVARNIFALSLAALVAASPLMSWRFLHRRTNTQRTFVFLQDNLRKVDKDSPIVTLLRPDIGSSDPQPVFPSYMRRFDSGPAPISLGDFLARPNEYLDGEKLVYYYESPICYTYNLADFFSPETLENETLKYASVDAVFRKVNGSADKMERPACIEMKKRFRLKRIATEEFESDADTLCPVIQKRVHIGLYMITGMKQPEKP